MLGSAPIFVAISATVMGRLPMEASVFSTTVGSPFTFGSAFFGAAFFGSAFFGSAFFGSAFFGSAFFGAAFFGSAFFGSALTAFFGSAYFGSASTGVVRFLLSAIFWIRSRTVGCGLRGSGFFTSG